MVYIILGTGFEEMEALVPCDLLRRGGVEVRLVGIGGLEITGGHGITVKADCTEKEADWSAAELLVLPGGLGGVAAIEGSDIVMNALRSHAGPLAAICAAPTVLAHLGLTDGLQATCYPGMEVQMGNAQMQAENVVQDGRILTGRAAGAAFPFGLALLELLQGREVANRVAAEVVYDRR